MSGRLRLDRSGIFVLVYSAFMLLFTLYITQHVHYWRGKGDNWWYYIQFLFFSGEVFLILQGLLLRSRNWGIVLLLPVAILFTTGILLFAGVLILRWGGGDLLDADAPDMIFSTIVFVGLSVYSLRWIGGGSGRRK